MAQYRDTTPASMAWIHELAKLETGAESGLQNLPEILSPDQLIEENTIDFLTELRGHFDDFARAFNAYSETSVRFPDIKIYSLAASAAGFMLYRNQMKLVVSNVAHGAIQFAFSHHQRGMVSVDGQPMGQNEVLATPQELVAQVSAFRDVSWTFQDEKVTAAQVARFYFIEFTQLTRDSRTLISRDSHQSLLDQIKSLLEEKGLDLK